MVGCKDVLTVLSFCTDVRARADLGQPPPETTPGGKNLCALQDNSSFLFQKQGENGNVLLLLAATMNVTTTSPFWNVSEEEIKLCGDHNHHI